MARNATVSPRTDAPVADKLTHLITDALARAAADPGGVPLFGTKADPGLFPPTAAAKPAAARALDDGLLAVVRTDAKGKQPREFAAATEKGLRFLLDQVSPKQVLDDFVRALERREGEVAELIGAANRMADSLTGLKAAVAVVLPTVHSSKLRVPSSEPVRACAPAFAGYADSDDSFSPLGTRNPEPGTTEDLADAVLGRLADWAASAVAGQDCPLPDLYRSLTTRDDPPTVGQFHDCLRQLCDQHRVYLHPWTGPLYALPEPNYAVLAGHNVAYYASLCRS